MRRLPKATASPHHSPNSAAIPAQSQWARRRGAQLGHGMGVLVETGELSCGFPLSAADHHLRQGDLVDKPGGQRGFPKNVLASDLPAGMPTGSIAAS